MSELQLPSDEMAEQSVLSAMMNSSHIIAEVTSVLSGGDFWSPAHELMFDAMVTLERNGNPTDPVAVSNELDRAGTLHRAGGRVAVSKVFGVWCPAPSATYYARIVREKAILRRIVQAGTRITSLGYAADGGDAETIAQAAADEIAAAVSSGVKPPSGVNLADRFDDLLNEIDEPLPADAGVSWGSGMLDGKLHPMRPGQLVIVGARPRVGKSTWVRNVAADVALRQRKRVLIHTMEMSRQEYEECILAAESSVYLSRIVGHRCTLDDYTKMEKVRGQMEGAVLVIDDTPDLSLEGLWASMRLHKPDLVIIDQLQHLRPPDNGRKGGSRQEDVGRISRGLKTLAGLEKCVIMACSKMNRESEKAQDKTPSMAMLRDSGEIESDADTVVLIHREDVYEKESPRAGEADFIIEKQRAGQRGTVVRISQLEYSRFVDHKTVDLDERYRIRDYDERDAS